MSTKKLITSAQGYLAKSNVFFMDQKTKAIRVYITQEEPEVEDDSAKNYTQDFVTVDVPDSNKPQRITVTSPDMSAIAWQIGDDPGTTNTRLYYADADNTLQELCRDTDKATWYRGSLGNTVRVKCMQDTPIDAHINYSSQQLKVYSYSPENTTTPTVTWTTVNQTNWQSKLIVK
ncbi:hypothetical protein A1O1_06065 [Capronia coronata CBS 617.96]|uniref:Uncharacterized protein n=1 Tax=Capronia coronata CBS 617.96 TaxID=1182541 RepID=W9XYR1_9EURO|nr:uncharacterized protein A1O1_06065 [Capronia coronata CBS 617.96]EXJ85697.1 hypothetical protein A1O1_06065 [Capronia coronata CBS 617.96]